MNLLRSIFKDFFLFFAVTPSRVRFAFILLLILISASAFLIKSTKQQDSQEMVQVPAVVVAPVTDFDTGASLNLIGTVSATSKAVILSEAPGRVVSVNVELGDTVYAGQKIAQLENASAYAALIQAEGAYDAAIAAAQVSGVSITEAENAQRSAQDSAINVYRTAYTTVSNIVFNTLDVFYSDPQYTTPGVKVNAGSQTSILNQNRVALGVALDQWRDESVALTNSVDLYTVLDTAKIQTNNTMVLLDAFISIVEDSDNTDTLDGKPLSTFSPTLYAARTTLSGTLASIDAAARALDSSQELITKAKLGGSNEGASVADAQVKQALGALKAAQANYNKTILRSTIAGKVNLLEVDTGDYVGAFQKVAEIANNDSLEITTYVSQSDLDRISILQEVFIEDSIVGVISTIAPAVDTKTGKIEVKIQTTSKELVNGSTVSVLLPEAKVDFGESSSLQVPLTAVKFSATAGSVFTVENSILIEHSVEIGSVHDSYIEILSGLEPTSTIVVDARGRSAGEEVKILTE
jgi:RND family efflux transporter MFP subunit